MHPTTERLLAVRDGIADAEARAHVDMCAECGAEVARLARTRDALQALPEVAPPPGAFARLTATRTAARRRARGTRHAALAVAASVVMAVALLVVRQPPAPPMIAADAGVAELAARSNELDSVLAAVESQTGLVDLRTAGAIVALEDQLATVDARLRRLGPTDDRAAEQLLRRRIALVNALVDVHAARIQYSF